MPTSAKVILDSISPEGVRLTTMELRYARSIHAEFMTHRVYSRNASSSRAIPVEKLIDEAMNDPAYPERWGTHAKGMQDGGAMSDIGSSIAKADWCRARDAAVSVVEQMLCRPERASKQIINRLLEPFTHITVVVTGTQWLNFYHLRDHEDADPTMLALARAVRAARDASTPKVLDHGNWHLPYVTDDDLEAIALHVFQNLTPQEELDGIEEAVAIERVVRVACRVSTARCARVSYLTHDGRKPDVTEDINLFNRLMLQQPLHASPAEHQATPDSVVRLKLFNTKTNTYTIKPQWTRPELHGNLVGWQQHRKMFVGEAVHDHARVLDLKG